MKLWEFPAAPQDLEDVTPAPTSGQDWKLRILYNASDGRLTDMTLALEGVESLKITYATSVAPIAIRLAYNQLVDLGETSWLSEVAAARDAARQGLPGVPPKLHHLLVYFSDHASYEFICAGYRVSDKTAQAS
jgi:hypothetical protein